MEESLHTQSVTIRSHKTVPLSDVEPGGTPELRAGQQLGNYQVVRLLAEGGFAEIYLGEHVHLGTYAAIKVLKARLTQKDLKAFRDEARIVARLRHSHIVSILDFDVQGDMPFLVMDYAPHGTLRQRHPSGVILPPAALLPYLTQVGDALQYAHNQRLVHRDVKPENMLLGWNDEILLSDFGIAVMLQTSRVERAHEVIGTITYMSPEQLSGSALPASDQYSLGVATYEWLCGQTPFRGTTIEVANQHIHALPPPISRRNTYISPELEQVVMRALAKDPERRYPNVQMFVRAFTAACPQQAIMLSDSAVIHLNRDEIPAFSPLDATTYVPPMTSAFQSPPRREKRVTRRGVLFGISVGLGLATGGVAWALKDNPQLFSQLLHTTATSTAKQPQKPQPTPTQGPPTSGTVLLTYREHTGLVDSAVWSPANQTYMASASWDRTIRVWNTMSGADVRSYSGHSDVVNTAAWSPDGKSVASGSNDTTVQVWLALQDDPQTITYTNHTGSVNTVAWSSDGLYVASGSNDTTVRVWNPQDNGNDRAVYTQHTAPVRSVAWAPAPATMGKRVIASAGIGKTVQIWDARNPDDTPLQIYRQHTDTVNAIAWSPDGRYIVSASADMTVQVWLTYGDDNPFFVYKGHTAGVNAAAWSPDGNRIASASNDGTVHLWDATTGNTVYIYHGHSLNVINSVYSVGWSPDGTFIASAGADKLVYIWHV